MGRTRVLRDARCRHPHGSRSRSDVHQSWPGASAHVSSPGKFARRERAHRSCDDSCVCVWFEACDCCGRRMGDVFAFPVRDAARCVFTMRRGSPLPPGIWNWDGGDAACCKLVQISFAEMVLKEHGVSASGAVPSAQTWNRASAPAPFPNLERVPQRLKPDFRPALTARLRFAEAVPLQNLRKSRNTPANLDSLAARCVFTGLTRHRAFLKPTPAALDSNNQSRSASPECPPFTRYHIGNAEANETERPKAAILVAHAVRRG